MVTHTLTEYTKRLNRSPVCLIRALLHSYNRIVQYNTIVLVRLTCVGAARFFQAESESAGLNGADELCPLDIF